MNAVGAVGWDPPRGTPTGDPGRRPPTLRPRDGTVTLVRWRQPSGHVGQRYYQRAHFAHRFVQRLRAAGYEVQVFATDTTWHAAQDWP